MIGVVDYGVGNIGSIVNMLRRIGANAQVCTTVEDVAHSEKLILPGVGAFDYGIQRLVDSGLIPAISEKVLKEKRPILGICLGMQLFTEMSEEGARPGLGWVSARTVRFRFVTGQKLPIPHMGWNLVHYNCEEPLFRNLEPGSRFYFVHSYHVICQNDRDIIAKARYGYEFTAAFRRGNITGVQFHPEKSHRFGMRLLRNFVSYG